MSDDYISGNAQTFSALVEMEASDSIRLELALLKIEQLQALLYKKNELLSDALDLAFAVAALDNSDGIPSSVLYDANAFIKKF